MGEGCTVIDQVFIKESSIQRSATIKLPFNNPSTILQHSFLTFATGIDFNTLMNIQDRFKKIKAFIFDVDGVLTDGTVLLLENGLQARRMNVKDGYALQLAIKR